MQPLATPLVGSVQAGFPSPATEALSDTITLHEYLVEHPSTSFFYTVEDDEMARHGIQRGDVVVIEPKQAHPGDFVLADVDGEIMLRDLWKDGPGFMLASANPDTPPIRKCGEVQILGVVVALARKLKN